jgi:molybdopterin synthase catalytic subunit/molybdopterin converting factor small subunit
MTKSSETSAGTAIVRPSDCSEGAPPLPSLHGKRPKTEEFADNQLVMRVTLLAFGMLRDLLPSSGGLVDLPAGATVGNLIDQCRTLTPENTRVWSSIAVAVNREYVEAAHLLEDGDEVALLPPVSGGASDTATGPLVALVEETIDSAGLVAGLKWGADGAVATFDGIVRNQTRGRRTLYLYYEAYPEMALDRMKLLAAQALADYPIRDVVLVHRLGRLEIGESSVFIAVASAHRAAAFDACRWLIDTLKQTVPIWKKEFFEDGAVWAAGEAFPPYLTPETNGHSGSGH